MPKCLVVAACAFLVPLAAAQDHGLPGARPGTERWVAVLDTRSFDLRELREAIRARRADEAARAIATLETAVVADQRGFGAFVEGLGGRVERQWWLINACLIEVAPARLADVRRHARVRSLVPDAPHRPGEAIKESIDARNHRADGLHAVGILGEGVAVAVLDTGQDADMNGTGRPHSLYFVDGDPTNQTGGGIGGSRLLANVQVGALSAEDSLSHGTAVAAVTAGERWNTSSSSARGHAPRARLVGYSIADLPNGLTSTATVVSAWQRVVADSARYGIAVANNSYHGDPDPTYPAQQALCAAVLTADLLVVVLAGNLGSSAIASQACANGVAVGATTKTTRVLASFSSRGPLPGDYRRTYPDLVADGVDLVMPSPDDETAAGNMVASGTSFASPQVAGAAALYRSVARAATHLETKAALLATAEELLAKTETATRNEYGLGYLRDDLLLDVALRRRGALVVQDTVTASAPSRTHRFGVTAGSTHAAVIAWDRHDVTSRAWSDLDLEVVQGGTVLAVSRSPRNLYEKVVFRPARTGTVDLVVTSPQREIAAVPFALVAVEDLTGQGVAGSLAPFGAGCPGSGAPAGPEDVVPRHLATEFGLHYFEHIFGYGTHRVQVSFDGALLPPGPLAITGLALRQDERLPSRTAGEWIELQLDMGESAVGPAALQPTFAANVTTPLTRVFDKKVLNMPAWTSTGTDPRVFGLSLILDRPLVWAGGAGRHLLLDAVRSDSSQGSGTFRYVADGILDPVGLPVSHVFNRTLTEPAGIVRPGEGPVLGFLVPGARAVAPILEPRGKARAGLHYALELLQGAAGRPAAVLTGLSDRVWAGVALPLPLGVYGAPGCSLLTSVEVSVGFAVTASGAHSQPFLVPNVPAVIHSSVFHQVAIDDPGANGLGLAFSNGVLVIPGG